MHSVMTMSMKIMNTKICTIIIVKLTSHTLAGDLVSCLGGAGNGFIFGGGPTLTSEHKNIHCSAVKWPLVSMSAIWSLVWMYLPKTDGSVETLSNNQSKSTRCVRATCLIAGLRPFSTILRTASLSSIKTSLARPSGAGTVGGT